ncbi:hypothetical protein LP7551_04943 [Roseibium album]|nr:hypothetical protein LP7551_04943 [Roseibium album]
MDLSQIILSQTKRENRYTYDQEELDRSILRAEHRRRVLCTLAVSSLGAMKKCSAETLRWPWEFVRTATRAPVAK